MTDRLAAMEVFAAVAAARSFAGAARRLGLSPSAVTRAVAGLEERLGARLLHRTTRVVRLTDAGARFEERCRRALAEVEEAERAARDERAEPRGRLVVAAPVLFGRLRVAPLVSALLAAHPALRVELRLSDRFADLVEDGVDVAVRIGELPDSGLVARRLGATRRVLVAGPAYLAGPRGAPARPEDLAGHDLIAFVPVVAARRWSFAGPGGAPLAVAVEPRLVTDGGDAALAHAEAGGGIAAVLCYQAEEALAAGRLVEVLGAFAPPPVPVRAVVPSARLLAANVRAFLEAAEAAAAGWRRG